MNINELYSYLGLTEEPKEVDTGMYSANIINSNTYDKLYSKLDSSSEFSLDNDDFELSADENKMIFFNDQYNIELKADFNANTYTVIIYEVK